MPAMSTILEDPADSCPGTDKDLLLGIEVRTCPECRVRLVVPQAADEHVVYCAACGQCLAAPRPISPALTDWGMPRPLWPFADPEKLPGIIGVVAGLAFAAVWSIESVNLYGRLMAVMLGGALIAEGLSRIRNEARRDQPRRRAKRLAFSDSTPESIYELGSLKAVFATKNDWLESLAICFLGLTCAAGGVWLIDWIVDGGPHPKLLLGLVLAPLGVVFFLYRSIRNVLDRRAALVFSGGLVVMTARGARVIPRQQIVDIVCERLGDAIDEHAVQVVTLNGGPAVRFTRCDFTDLEQLWQRLVQEYCSQSEPEPNE